GSVKVCCSRKLLGSVGNILMKAGAQPSSPFLLRGAGLFDRVDYRLIDTPEERDAVYAMRYRAYLHGGLILPSESRRIIDTYDGTPNAWIFGVYTDGDLCRAILLHILTSEERMSYSTELFGDIL